ncbi:MAG: type II toxin-antitoxin system VapC family toxin [Hyphomicrobiales bacterium]|nr:type II toxin-antitoxin system VapC family toxin [Hyphomicrobiales bacterium]
MTKLIVDASVAVRWFVPIDENVDIGKWKDISASYIAPDLILAESANAFLKYVKAGIMKADQMRSAVNALQTQLEDIKPITDLTEAAAEIALALKHPVYDCFYLALAQRENAPLVTADKRLAAAATALSNVNIHLISA